MSCSQNWRTSLSVVCDKAEAYIKSPLGAFALTKPVRRPPLAPKRFLVQISPERLKELEEKKCPMKEATVKCIITRTGARFCLVTYDETELEAMEMCRPTHRFKHIIQKREEPTIQECRVAGKNDFLVVQERVIP